MWKSVAQLRCARRPSQLRPLHGWPSARPKSIKTVWVIYQPDFKYIDNRGVILYANHDIKSKQVFIGDNFKENVTLEVKLSNIEKL